MRIGFTEKEFKKWNRWDNSMKPLHDPKRFNILIPDCEIGGTRK